MAVRNIAALYLLEGGRAVSRWLFRAYLGWRRGWVEAARAKQRRHEARARLERWKAEHAARH